MGAGPGGTPRGAELAGGRSASCHMVFGRGSPIGPDLSKIGAEMIREEIRTSLLQPSARISPGYELVTVKLPDGDTVRGFARNRSNFDIALQDLAGRLRPVREHEIAAVQVPTSAC